MSDFDLPSGFEALAEHSDWAIPTERGRSQRRQASSMEQIGAFYGAMTARIDDIFAHLNAVPIDEVAGADENLLLLTLSLQEIAICVENYHGVAVPDGWPIEDVTITKIAGSY